MSARGLLYFLPQPKVSRGELEGLGLAHLLERNGPGPEVTPTDRGPDGAPGVVFCVPGRNGLGRIAGVAAETAKWSRIDGSPAWVGFLEGERPGPEDLARKDQIGGHLIELAGGQRWLVPVARLASGATRFPRVLKCVGGVWVEGDVRQPYSTLFAAALKTWDELTRASTVEMSTGELTGIAVSALALNYRVGPAELTALELLDTDSMLQVLKALVDWPVIDELLAEEKRGKEEAAAPS